MGAGGISGQENPVLSKKQPIEESKPLIMQEEKPWGIKIPDDNKVVRVRYKMGFIARKRNQSAIDIISSAFLITKTLVLTKKRVQFQKPQTKQNLCFLLDYSGTYDIATIDFPQPSSPYPGNLNSYCLIRLKKPVAIRQSIFILGINMPLNKQSIGILEWKQNNRNDIVQGQVILNQIKYQKRNSAIQYNIGGSQTFQGCPLIDFQEQAVVGMQVEISANRQNCIARAIDEDFIRNIFQWMTIEERKQVYLFCFSKQKSINIQEYIQQLMSNKYKLQGRNERLPFPQRPSYRQSYKFSEFQGSPVIESFVGQILPSRKYSVDDESNVFDTGSKSTPTKNIVSPDPQTFKGSVDINKNMPVIPQKPQENQIIPKQPSSNAQDRKLNIQQDFKQRMGGYIDFSISGKYIEYITVDGVRLYYELYNPPKEYTIDHLAQQYFQATKKQLNLSWKNVELAPKTPLKAMICNKGRRQIFQKLMNCNQTVEIGEVLPSWYIQQLHESQSKSSQFRKNQLFIQIRKEKILVQNISQQILISTTIKQVLEDISATKFYKFDNFDIISENRRIVPKQYETPISQLHISTIKIIIYETSCYISVRSNVIIDDIIINRTISINFLEQFKDKKILSFDQKNSSLNYQKINKRKVSQSVTNFCILKYKYQNKVYELKCKEYTQVRVQKIGWRKVRDMQLGQRLLGVSEDLRESCLFTLYQRQYHFDTGAQNFCGLQIENTHTFIANRLIIHNQDYIEINVKQNHQNYSKQYTIKVSNSDKIGSKFQDADVYLAGVLLNKSLSFGDYHISKCKQLVVTKKNSKKIENFKQNGSIVSEWGKETMRTDSYSKEQLQKWQKSHLCFYQNKILQIEHGFRMDDFQHCILVQRLYFQRYNFYQNVKKYEINPQLVLKKYPFLQNNQLIRQIIEKHPSVPQVDLRLIFLYTAGPMYRPLNKTLRDQNTLGKVEKESRFYLCYSQLLLQSLSKLPALTDYTTVYRGARISKEVLDQVVNRLILFKGFTSTSKDKQKALGFIKNGFITDIQVLFVIKTLTGKQIYEFSMAKQEKEVLISPFTYFFIDKQTYQDDIKTIYITQVCLPCKDVDNIVFWVDDNPSNNQRIIKKIRDEVEVVQTVSTRLMKLIIENFLWIYTIRGKKITIITDMQRKQDEQNNKKAGVDLMMALYKDYGRSTPGLVYTSKRDATIKLIQQEDKQNSLKDKYQVFTIQSQLISQIEKIL